ncbi:MAG: ShlB/FhaC/HecB family hemolysin secretion/activation protein [Elusimicrobiota bacterium]|jgi:hemolysin activation/secretion protein|nr:ShlB/FhaC/HecB family hemolysin secretion/activation protein [Elusimicrobiota bacterium]
MNKIFVAFLSIMFVLGNFNIVFAATPEQSAEYIQRQISQQQEQEKRNIENMRQINSTQKVRDSRVNEGIVEPTKKDIVLDDADKNVPRFDKIIVRGNKVYPYRVLNKKVLSKFIGKPINKENVFALQTMLTNFYISSGYTMARVYFDQEHIIQETDKLTGKKTNTFVLVIEEGKINAISLKKISAKADGEDDGNTKGFASNIKNFRNSLQLFFAYGFKSGKTFNMKDFEQGLDQMNRLQSNNITMDIKPSVNLNNGYSDILIINNQDPNNKGVLSGSRTIFLNLNYNNSGSKSTGEQVLNLSISQDNLLAINDNIFLSYTESADSLFYNASIKKDENTDYGLSHIYDELDFFKNDDNKLKYSKSIYTAMSFPFTYWTINAGLNYSDYKTTVSGYYNKFHITGRTISQTYSLDRVAYRTQLYKLNVGSTLEIKDSESYIRDIRSETSARKTSNISFYLNNTIYTKFGTIIFKPSYQKGLDWFNSKTDSDIYGQENILDSDPRLQYNLLKAYLYFNTRLNLGIPFIYTVVFDSQYSFDSLYGTNQISAGGEYTTRGFKDSVISGDNGFYMKNDIKTSVIQLLPKGLTNNKIAVSVLSKVSIGIFIDYGFVEDKYPDSSDKEYNAESGNMAGGGISLAYNGKYINWSLTYAKALHSPSYLQDRDNMQKENEAIYWKIGATW